MSDRAAILTEASETARQIAQRCRDKARTKAGDDRKHWTAMAAGAQMVALKLTEQADGARRPTRCPATVGEGHSARPMHPDGECLPRSASEADRD